MKRTLVIFTILMSLVLATSSAQVITKVGTTSAQFLKIGVGSRAIGMGSAFVGVAGDATALYWNPAGISWLQKRETGMAHNSWLAGTNFSFCGIVVPMGEMGTIGAALTSLSIPEMEVRTIEEPEGTGVYFGASDLALGLSYAKSLTDRFSFGLTVKYIHQKIWLMDASSFAIDVGTLYRSEFHNLRMGMSISNFGGKMRMLGENTRIEHAVTDWQEALNVGFIGDLRTGQFPLPLRFRVGLAIDLLKMYILNKEYLRLTLATDAVHPNDNTEYVNLGAELALLDMLSARIGYKALFGKDSEEGPTAGVGLKYNLENYTINIDYAYASFGRLGYLQRISIGIGF